MITHDGLERFATTVPYIGCLDPRSRPWRRVTVTRDVGLFLMRYVEFVVNVDGVVLHVRPWRTSAVSSNEALDREVVNVDGERPWSSTVRELVVNLHGL